ncbi:hypothetical protein HF086_017178 [Spodoptera exigua]|uniref:SPX domain-containing protein n=1 Tax=Spodoptera exigua TaxID=7107 RepID=A0A922SF36_SPOEX|nr:hypothetical protein HF086_017178 [Spodoptera exigua]
MKFAEHLSAHITPEWRKQYINYEEMKAMLYTAVEEAPSAENVEPEVLSRHFANFDETFFHYCDQELKKINTFYSEKLAEATRKFATLQSELKSHFDTIKPKGSGDNKKAIPRRKVQELKLAFSEFYLSLILLQNYQNLNYTGFRKILKKHDKLLNVSNGAQWRAEHVETSHFYTNKDIDRLISDTEATVTNDLEGGDRQKAMKKLRVPPLGEQQSPWTTFKVGLFSGSFIVLFITVVLSALFHEGGTENFKTAFRLYRGPFLLVEFIFLIGINVYGWRSSGVNHVLIFELDPRNHLSEQHLMELAAIFGVIWALISFERTQWFIITRALVNVVPAWTRFFQCLRRYRDSREAFPHLVNAGKYSTTFFVVLFATLRTLYNDFVLRFIWTVSFVLTENNVVSGETMTSILAPLEVFRFAKNKKNAKKTKDGDRKPLLKKESIQDMQLELDLSSKML